MRLITSSIVFIFCVTAVNARLGYDISSERRLQHRKLQWAPDEVAIPEQYIVVFKDNLFTANEDLDFVSEWVNAWHETSVIYEYGSVFRGVVLTKVPLFTLKTMVEDERVAFVEQVSLARVLCACSQP